MIVEVIVSILLIVVVVAQNSKTQAWVVLFLVRQTLFGGKQRGLDAFI